MRISTLQSFNKGLNSILDNQSSVNKTQQQVSSGRRVLTPADDPIAATKILQLQQDLAQRDQYDKNLTAAENRLNLEEAQLQSITKNITRLQELTVKAGDGALTLTDRQAIADEVREILGATADLMNSRDAGGDYIFGGFRGQTQPFQLNLAGRYDFEGDEGQRFLAIGASSTVVTGDSGKTLFVDIPSANDTFSTRVNPENTGTAVINSGFVIDSDAYSEFYPEDMIITFNPESAISPPAPNFTVRQKSDGRIIEGMANITYVPQSEVVVAGVGFKITGEPLPGDEFLVDSSEKQSLTDTVFRFMEGLNTLGDNPEDASTLEYLLEDTLNNFQAAATSVSEVRSEVGARLNVIENTRSLSADIELVNREVLSGLSDVDFAEAVSRLSLQSFLLEAAQQSYTSIQNLSLFNQL